MASTTAEVIGTKDNIATENNSLVVGDEEEVEIEQSDDDSSAGGDRDIPSTPSIRMVVSLTILGALDEISYFPALLVGHVFSPFELCVGTLFATLIIFVIVLTFLSKFKRLVEFLDSIPLYGIVGMFAVVLTFGLFVS